jgi:hypothetical protein
MNSFKNVAHDAGKCYWCEVWKDDIVGNFANMAF